jgi:hypothetical protein
VSDPAWKSGQERQTAQVAAKTGVGVDARSSKQPLIMNDLQKHFWGGRYHLSGYPVFGGKSVYTKRGQRYSLSVRVLAKSVTRALRRVGLVDPRKIRVKD